MYIILEDMDKNILSRLEEVDLKCFWKHEERDFTPWLSEEENIALLGEAIGMDLEVISREESVGSYRADILCKDSANGHFVVIENQIEQTDHKHLGQIITYGTGLNASSCIWIAKSFTGEHRAAIDWLNSISDDEHNFFAIEIKLYKIENSPLAPIFNVVAKPNDWSKLIKKGVASTPPTETKLLQQEYWSGFSSYVENQPKINFRTKRALPQSWYSIAIGNSNIYIELSINSKNKFIKVRLNINGSNPLANYNLLHTKLYEKSLKDISQELLWDAMEGRKQCGVELVINADFTNKLDWDNQFEWLYTHVEKFILLFKNEVKGLR